MKYKENHRNFKYWDCLIYVLYLLLPVSTMYKVPQPSLSSAGGKKYNKEKASNFAILIPPIQ
jgi:hypothetical protein